VISVLVAVGCMNQAKNKSYLLTMYNYDLAAFSMYNYACQVLTFNPSKVDMTEIGLIHLQTHEDVQWEPIAGDDYLINASDDEDGEQHGSSSTAPTNLFLRTRLDQREPPRVRLLLARGEHMDNQHHQVPQFNDT
jgi:hypothetical protein